MLTSTRTIAFAPNVVLQMIDGDALILKLRDETFFSLNPTGARVAQLISQGCRVDAMLDRVSLTYPEIDGVGGKGAALRTIFEIAAQLNVQALVVVDSDLRSIVPEWIELLAGPILKGGYDFVAPLYARYKYDGTITNTVTYPLTRALYGHRIRQPIGGDFGVSGDLVKH